MNNRLYIVCSPCLKEGKKVEDISFLLLSRLSDWGFRDRHPETATPIADVMEFNEFLSEHSWCGMHPESGIQFRLVGDQAIQDLKDWQAIGGKK